jgi:hypothetical protein
MFPVTLSSHMALIPQIRARRPWLTCQKWNCSVQRQHSSKHPVGSSHQMRAFAHSRIRSYLHISTLSALILCRGFSKGGGRICEAVKSQGGRSDEAHSTAGCRTGAAGIPARRYASHIAFSDVGVHGVLCDLVLQLHKLRAKSKTSKCMSSLEVGASAGVLCRGV